jgi:hypothetical protein
MSVNILNAGGVGYFIDLRESASSPGIVIVVRREKWWGRRLRLRRRARRTSIPDRMTMGQVAAFAGTVVALALILALVFGSL